MYSTTILLKDINRLQNMVHIKRYIDMYRVIHLEAATNKTINNAIIYQ